MTQFLDMIRDTLSHYPFVAPIIFVCVHIIMAASFLPCSPMTLMAGALWGSNCGLILSMIAAVMSSATTFLLSRTLFHRRIELFFTNRYPRLLQLLTQVTIHDWKIIAISQMNPLVPASALGYAFGLSRIPFRRYLLFSIIFMLPLQALFVMTGHSVIESIRYGGRWKVALALVLLVIIVSFFSKRIYSKLCELIGVKNGA